MGLPSRLSKMDRHLSKLLGTGILARGAGEYRTRQESRVGRLESWTKSQAWRRV